MITNEMLDAYDTAILNHSPLADHTCDCGQKFKTPGDWHDHKISKALEAVDAIRQHAIKRIRELHRPEPYMDEPTISFCRECQSCGNHGIYPCPTIQALEGN